MQIHYSLYGLVKIPVEKVHSKGQYDQSNAISDGFVYDNGNLYFGTGRYSGDRKSFVLNNR